ncbi:MAG: ABC transporter permease subunit [Rhodobacteraceae bacterium]|nr:ABC transporter permease subunit [Paracoccaceae bacterium]
MLLYDTRYRSITIQIIMLGLFVAGVWWLLDNMYSNLDELGKRPNFTFLTAPAGYDINQRLIEYSSQSTNARAWLVGLLNTLLVAVMGCILATVLGVSIGVLRLSKNWIIARLMTAYIEIFRNVPLLLLIIFAMSIFINIFPQPKLFRGEDALSSMYFWDSVAFTNRGWYIPKPVFESGSMIVGIVFLLSIAGIFVFGRWAKKRQEATGEILPNFWIKLGILVIPAVVFYYIMGQPISLNYPELKGFNFKGGLHLRNSLIALWLALSLYTAAFIAEAVRAGIMAIDKGQTEAAAALGLRPKRIMKLVVLPQALRVIIPPLISQYLNLTKNSSLAVAVGYMDLTGTLGGITLNQTGRALESILLLMITYLAISLSISMVMNFYNNSVKLKER